MAASQAADTAQSAHDAAAAAKAQAAAAEARLAACAELLGEKEERLEELRADMEVCCYVPTLRVQVSYSNADDAGCWLQHIPRLGAKAAFKL